MKRWYHPFHISIPKIKFWKEESIQGFDQLVECVGDTQQEIEIIDRVMIPMLAYQRSWQ